MLALFTPSLAAQEEARPGPGLLESAFGRPPIYFIEDRSVYPDEVAYYVQGSDKALFFTRDGITFRLKGEDKSWVVTLEFVGANSDVKPRGESRQQAVFSYFNGPEKDWKTGLETFARVVYEDLWPGIDLVYKGTVNRLKYAFVLDPGADPGKIPLRYRRTTGVATTNACGLRVQTSAGSFEDEPPVAWQVIHGERVPVAMAFQLSGEPDENGHEFGFRVGDDDRSLPLILDPALPTTSSWRRSGQCLSMRPARQGPGAR